MEKDYLDMLYEKCRIELTSFENDLINMQPKEILNHAYELVMKRDMFDLVENERLPPDKAKSLCRLQFPLDSCYREWLHNDMSYMDMLQDSMENVANKESRKIREEKKRSR